MSNHYIVSPGSNLKICVEKKIYGHKSNLLGRWVRGDRVIYYVNSSFVAVGVVASEPFFEKTEVWPDGTYPYRIRINPILVLPRDKWLALDQEIAGLMQKHLGQYWVLHAVRGLRPVPKELFDQLEKLMSSKGHFLLQDAPFEEALELQGEARKQIQYRKKERTTPQTKQVEKQIEIKAEETIGTAKEIQSHDRTQWYLIKLGRALGCEVWVAKNDRSKSYNGETFSKLSLSKMPNLGFDQDTSRIIENIDVLWLKGSVIQCAFEVEHTTSIYSGLLRMADLVASQPHIKIKLFIVAPQERRHQVVYQLNRPVFENLLRDVCKYIPYDKLESTLAKIEDFQGYLQVGLIETIAEGFSGKKDIE